MSAEEFLRSQRQRLTAPSKNHYNKQKTRKYIVLPKTPEGRHIRIRSIKDMYAFVDKYGVETVQCMLNFQAQNSLYVWNNKW